MDGKKADALVTDPPYGIGIDGQKASKASNPKHDRKAHEFRGWDKERPTAATFELLRNYANDAIIWGGNYFADMLPATRGWLVWDKGQKGLTMSDGELAWTTFDKPLRIFKANRAQLHGSVHPTQKPASLIEWCLNMTEGIVFDPFLGSGTTLIAAEKTGRTCYGIELDCKYCDVIVKRWEDFTGKKAELVS
jgi:DNA modification methylase